MTPKISARAIGIALNCVVAAACIAADDEPATKDAPKKSDAPPVVKIDESANQHVIETVLDSEIEVRLVGDRRMTGWCAPDPWPAPPEKKEPPQAEKHARPPKVLRYLGPSFEAAADAKDSAIGTYIFKYKAVGTGERVLTFNYIYPDGHGYENMPRLATQLVRQVNITVRVGEAK